MATASKPKKTALHPATNAAATLIAARQPYTVAIIIQGTTDLLFHRYNPEVVAEITNAGKGHESKKHDPLEAYVYRLPNGHLALPGIYLQRAMVQAARFHQDPRSKRKSLHDLAEAAFVVTPTLADLGVADWDYIDRRRAVVQMNAVTRARPALLAGWQAAFHIDVLLPEYITPTLLQELAMEAGRFVGVGDFRPTYGRFAVTHFEVLHPEAEEGETP